MLLAADVLFHNAFWPEDVDNSLRVTPLDALQVINALNDGGARSLAPQAGGGEGEGTAASVFLPDVNGDNLLTPLDALQVIDVLNRGEGEVAPTDIVRYGVDVVQPDGSELPQDAQGNYLVNVGDTFQVQVHVQDNRAGFFPPAGTSNFNTGDAAGVFSSYLDIVLDNKDAVQLRYGETQRLTVNAQAAPTQKFRLQVLGQQTVDIVNGEEIETLRTDIENALTAILGQGNVEVTWPADARPNADRYFDIRFTGQYYEQNMDAIGVIPTLPLGGTVTITDNYYPADIQNGGTFLSSFPRTGPYINGASVAQESSDSESDLPNTDPKYDVTLDDPNFNPQTHMVYGELGAFLDFFQLSLFGTTAGKKAPYDVLSFDLKATNGGMLGIYASPTEGAGKETMTIAKNDSGAQEDQFEVDPANIGFVKGVPVQDPNTGAFFLADTPLDVQHKIMVKIREPLTADNDAFTVGEHSGTTALDVLDGDVVDPAAGGVGPVVLDPAGLGAVSPNGAATVAVSNGKVNFTPNGDFNGQATFTYDALDSASPAHRDTATVTVTVTPVNDPPVNSAPTQVTKNEGSTVTFDGSDAGLISISDADAGSADVQVTLAATNGLLTLGDSSQADFGFQGAVGDGTNDATMTFRGTTAEINTALNGTTFTPQDANFNGQAQVTITTDDLGNTGGPNQVDTDTIAITIDPVNDDPVNSVPLAGQEVDSDMLPLVFSGANSNLISVSDPDGDVTVEVSLTLQQATGTLTLPQTTGLTFQGGANGTAAMTFRGITSDVNAALDGLQYDKTVAGQSAQDTLQITTDDLGNIGGGNRIDTDTVSITVRPPERPFAVNDSAEVNEGGGAKIINVLANDWNAADPSVQNGPGLKVTGVGPLTQGLGTVTFTDTTVTYTTPTGQDADFNGPVTFTYTVIDDQNNLPNDGPSTATVSVNVLPVNDKPSFSASNVQISEDPTPRAQTVPGWATFQAGAANESTQSAEQYTVNVLSGAGLFETAPAVGTDGTLTYTPNQDAYGEAKFNVTVKDTGGTDNGGVDTSDPQEFTITIDPVNDAPVNTIGGSDDFSTKPQTTDDNVSLPFTNGNLLQVADVDAGNRTTFQVDLEVTVSDTGTLTLGNPPNGVTVTDVDTQNPGTHLRLNSSATLQGVNTALGSLVYHPKTNWVGDTGLKITTNDGGADGDATQKTDVDTVSITVASKNDPPVAKNDAVTTAEGTPKDFNVFADNGNGADSAGPNEDGFQDIDVQSFSAAGTQGTVQLLDAETGQFRYTPPDDDFNGQTTFTYTIVDNGTNPANQTDTGTVTITVTPVNDPPIANPDSLLIDLQHNQAGQQTNFNVSQLLQNDQPGPADESGQSLSIVSVTGNATLNNGTITYTVPAGGLQDHTDTFTYTLQDGGNPAQQATGTVTVHDVVPESYSGYVTLDMNNNGHKDAGDLPLVEVTVTLTGTDLQGSIVNLQTRTDANGHYQFDNVLPSQAGTPYDISRSAPFAHAYANVGDQGGQVVNQHIHTDSDRLTGFANNAQGVNNNFGQVPGGGDTQEEQADSFEQGAAAGIVDVFSSDIGNVDGTPDPILDFGLLFESDAGGNVLWYVDLGGWTDYRPSADANGIADWMVNVTDTHGAQPVERQADASAMHERLKQVGNVTRIFGKPADFGLDNYASAPAPQGEGESTPEARTIDMLAAAGDAAQYAAAVDAVLAEVAELSA